MKECCDLYVLSALACKLGECLDEDQINILAAQLNTLGDMLELIAAKKSRSD